MAAGHAGRVPRPEQEKSGKKRQKAGIRRLTVRGPSGVRRGLRSSGLGRFRSRCTPQVPARPSLGDASPAVKPGADGLGLSQPLDFEPAPRTLPESRCHRAQPFALEPASDNPFHAEQHRRSADQRGVGPELCRGTLGRARKGWDCPRGTPKPLHSPGQGRSGRVLQDQERGRSAPPGPVQGSYVRTSLPRTRRGHVSGGGSSGSHVRRLREGTYVIPRHNAVPVQKQKRAGKFLTLGCKTRYEFPTSAALISRR